MGSSDPVALHALATAIHTWPRIHEAIWKQLLAHLEKNLKA